MRLFYVAAPVVSLNETISQVLCNLVLRLSSVRRSFVVLLRDSLIWDRHPRGGNRMEQKYEILEFTAI